MDVYSYLTTQMLSLENMKDLASIFYKISLQELNSFINDGKAALYILYEGSADLVTSLLGQTIHLACLHPGDTFLTPNCLELIALEPDDHVGMMDIDYRFKNILDVDVTFLEIPIEYFICLFASPVTQMAMEYLLLVKDYKDILFVLFASAESEIRTLKTFMCLKKLPKETIEKHTFGDMSYNDAISLVTELGIRIDNLDTHEIAMSLFCLQEIDLTSEYREGFFHEDFNTDLKFTMQEMEKQETSFDISTLDPAKLNNKGFKVLKTELLRRMFIRYFKYLLTSIPAHTNNDPSVQSFDDLGKFHVSQNDAGNKMMGSESSSNHLVFEKTISFLKGDLKKLPSPVFSPSTARKFSWDRRFSDLSLTNSITSDFFGELTSPNGSPSNPLLKQKSSGSSKSSKLDQVIGTRRSASAEPSTVKASEKMLSLAAPPEMTHCPSEFIDVNADSITSSFIGRTDSGISLRPAPNTMHRAGSYKTIDEQSVEFDPSKVMEMENHDSLIFEQPSGGEFTIEFSDGSENQLLSVETDTSSVAVAFPISQKHSPSSPLSPVTPNLGGEDDLFSAFQSIVMLDQNENEDPEDVNNNVFSVFKNILVVCNAHQKSIFEIFCRQLKCTSVFLDIAFDVSYIAERRSTCYYMFLIFLYTLDLVTVFSLDELRLRQFFYIVFDFMSPTNRYHNRKHVIDVSYAVLLFMKEMSFKEVFSSDEVLALMLCALVHDAGHFGKTEDVLRKTDHIVINKFKEHESPLEYFSVCIFEFALEQSGLLSHLDPTRVKRIINMCGSIILATDMKRHAHYLDMGCELEGMQLGELNESGRLVFLQLLFKCADISNLCRGFNIAKRWASRLYGEIEDMKKDFPDIPQSLSVERDDPATLVQQQMSFISYVAEPLFRLVITVLPQFKYFLDIMQVNYELWSLRLARINLTPLATPNEVAISTSADIDDELETEFFSGTMTDDSTKHSRRGSYVDEFLFKSSQLAASVYLAVETETDTEYEEEMNNLVIPPPIQSISESSINTKQ
ncbi:hypothetical protein PCE1_004600 [Barthelona sp. PCE]